jgi:hypothetical protein
MAGANGGVPGRVSGYGWRNDQVPSTGLTLTFVHTDLQICAYFITRTIEVAVLIMSSIYSGCVVGVLVHHFSGYSPSCWSALQFIVVGSLSQLAGLASVVSSPITRSRSSCNSGLMVAGRSRQPFAALFTLRVSTGCILCSSNNSMISCTHRFQPIIAYSNMCAQNSFARFRSSTHLSAPRSCRA